MTSSNIIVTLQNIDDEDFMFEYNASEGNSPYLIRAGEVARYPQFLANHALKHLIDKILNKRGERTNHRKLRLELADQIIIGQEKPVRKKGPSESEKFRTEVDELNETTTLETILNKRKEEKGHKKVIEKEIEDRKAGLGEKFEGLEDEPKVEELPTTEPKSEPEPKEEVKAKPTKGELFEYAEKELKMVMDDKTKKKFKTMKIDKMMEELNYPN